MGLIFKSKHVAEPTNISDGIMSVKYLSKEAWIRILCNIILQVVVLPLYVVFMFFHGIKAFFKEACNLFVEKYLNSADNPVFFMRCEIAKAKMDAACKRTEKVNAKLV